MFRGRVSNGSATPSVSPSAASGRSGPPNALASYFDSNREGPGIWKWRHYFDIYHRHFQKFVGQEVNVLEIGVYSGGSMGMWKDYFGPKCRVFGVDIEPACKSYESESVKIFIGDQADRDFWARVRREAPPFDIVIDDGGHLPHQQIVTLEETLPFLRLGGVFLCEDLHGVSHQFVRYVSGLAANLNAAENRRGNASDPERRNVISATAFQVAIHSVHFYPYITVIETNSEPVREFVAPKHGTQWQPFLS